MSTKNPSDIGHFARIPLHVARADVSETAKAMWRELAFLSSPESPIVWVRQADFAKKLNCCNKTIQRALKELVASNLLSFAGWLHGRYKRYKMAWKNFFGEAEPVTVTPQVAVKPVVVVKAEKAEKVETPTPALSNSSKKTPQEETSEVLEHYEREYTQRFPSLDGRAARPGLRACIEQALNHTARYKHKDLKLYLDMWLTNAAQKWHPQFVRDSGVYVQSPEEKQRARDWERIRHDQCEAEAAIFYEEKRRREKAEREAKILAHCLG
jgi:hypothetical protein